MVSCLMLKQGYSEQAVIHALISSSKNIEERKGKYTLDYAVRTVTKALKKRNEASQSKSHDEVKELEF